MLRVLTRRYSPAPAKPVPAPAEVERLFDQVSTGLMMVDLRSARILRLNDVALTIFGLGPDDPGEVTFDLLLPELPPMLSARAASFGSSTVATPFWVEGWPLGGPPIRVEVSLFRLAAGRAGESPALLLLRTAAAMRDAA